ncbi:hypothetical protein LAZ67_5002427 [Cordylochernes scorpioides]|uniref:Uncharacterized protein n=1 Tax=Cordylochernes scorpioides TaxID=51811 RepID=A0ABY6KGD6_9ARAC|nr:hypothetical protein LAZ67_5002427 [Cordylochernes scorpioides]
MGQSFTTQTDNSVAASLRLGNRDLEEHLTTHARANKDITLPPSSKRPRGKIPQTAEKFPPLSRLHELVLETFPAALRDSPYLFQEHFSRTPLCKLAYRTVAGGIQARHGISETYTKQATWEPPRAPLHKEVLIDRFLRRRRQRDRIMMADSGQRTMDEDGEHYVDASEVPATFIRPSLDNLVNRLTEAL